MLIKFDTTAAYSCLPVLLYSFVTISKSFRLNWPIRINKNTGSIVFYRKNGLQDVRHAEKNQIVLKAQTVYYPLVSQQQKLCKAEHSKDQAPADAAFNGP